ncbi:hypothetical protein M9H77_06502 [Catharanthus roseus]|uniref:Uncharacterized protein n=1 Tax=Catharanthus roseus TaxID=4058 RepID=A0ACC0BSI8_CATRO|nr:hypothetical protein M9H77_06502 [Catharanthus roseus]
MTMCENWQVFVHDGKHNHAIGVYTHGHTQAAKLMEEQLTQTERYRKSHVRPRNILQLFREQNVGCAVSMPLLEVIRMAPTENQEDVCDDEPKVIITDRESSLMPVIYYMFSIVYHMLFRRHIDQDVLAKLTELIKDEEAASRFVNVSWKDC